MNFANKVLLYIFFSIYPFYTVIKINSFPLALVLIGVLYLLFIIKIIKERKILIPKTFVASYLFLIVYFIFGDLLYTEIVLRDLLIFFWGGIPLLFVNFVKEEKFLENLIKVLFLSTVIISILIIMQYFQISSFDFIKYHTHKSGLVRFQGIGKYPNPNSFAVFVFMVFVLSLRFMYKKYLYIILNVFLIFVLILCESRGLLFGAIISVVLLLFWRRKVKKDLFIKVLKVVYVIFLFIALLIAYKPDNLIFKRIMMLNLNKRSLRWKCAVELWKKSPLIGVGLNNVKRLTAEKEDLDEKNIHNTYLETLAGTGVIGFSAFLLLLFNIYILLYNFSLKKKQYCFYFIIFISFFVFNLTHSMLFMSIFWIVLGIFEVEYMLAWRR